ncbi:hypothetical protein Trydic_g15369 [Trypoxylus dichotomus]
MSAKNSLSSLQTDINLVEQILEQGQRLRAAMVQTILNNDPFNIDILKTPNFKSYSETDALKPIHTVNLDNQYETKSLTLEDKHKFLAYLRGEEMTRNDERKVLDTFRAMSNADICDATERSYNSDYSCCCDTCKAYYKHNLSCDFNHSSTILCKDRHNVPPLKLNKNRKNIPIQTDLQKQINTSYIYPSHIAECLKYADSLKVSVHSLVLNQEGNKKMYGNSLVDKKLKLPTSITHTYFIEYQIPENISKLALRSKSKVNSGLDSHNLVRMCSKKLHNEAIYFKQISLHDVANLSEIDLATVNIKFQISCRTLKQKNSNVLGYATFNLASFLSSRHFSLNQNLLVMLNSDAPIVIGVVKVSLQLGCGQLYFGKEFIDAIHSNKENIKGASDSESSGIIRENKHQNTETSLVHSKNSEFCEKNYEVVNKKSSNRNISEDATDKSPLLDRRPVKETKEETPKQISKKEIRFTPKKMTSDTLRTHDTDKEVLFGFICVGEAQLTSVRNTFVTCQPFSQDDVLYSRLIYGSTNPYYNFSEVLPFVYDDTFLNKLRDNYMIFEFWEKINGEDILIGISKVSLHQFYIAFRNPVITKYLNRNKLPVIGCDRVEPICNPLNGEIYGQVEILVALGTDVQIHSLKQERGFESESIIAKPSRLHVNKQQTSPIDATLNSNINHRSVKIFKKAVDSNKKDEDVSNSIKANTEECSNRKKTSTKHKFTKTNREPGTRKLKSKRNLVDVAIQSDAIMADSRDGSNDTNVPPTSDILGAFLTQLLQQKQRNYVENSTNTGDKQNITMEESNREQDNMNNSKVRRTSDLLDSLQQALSINNPSEIPKQRPSQTTDTFRAHVVIESALHLPSRKKCIARITPSPYVTFETSSEFKVTPVIQENADPEWDYSCDVELPADLLTDNQKRLIFKVWKKVLNLPPFEPNFESDTILGIAAIDLTVLLAGMPTVSGWFNIVDFSNKCNGQIKISVTPLENLSRFMRCNTAFSTSIKPNPPISTGINKISQEIPIEKIEEPRELLSRTLKRKFTELDEITQRLKLRLSHVTNDESDTSNDELADEFERDINTLCVEDDYDMINFEEEGPKAETQQASHALLQIQNSNFIYTETNQTPTLSFSKQFNSNHESISGNINDDRRNLSMERSSNATEASSTNIESSDRGLLNIGYAGHLDKQLTEGRQKIDSLLEKLSLLNPNEAEAFGSRYVSGCSTKQDCSRQPVPDDILKDIRKNVDPISTDVSSEDNSTASLRTAYVSESPFNISNSTSSNSGLLTQYSEFRLAPDGAGNTPEDKIKLANTVIGSSGT